MVESYLGDDSRRIVERIVVTGDLVLQTPTHFGNGDSDGLVDLALARDPLDRDALLPGPSIAGALRSYLRTRILGFGHAEAAKVQRADMLAILFGYQQGDDGAQSSVLTSDARCRHFGVELRDGVAIDPVTRAADDKKKFDFELIEAGAIFPLRIELLVRAAGENDPPDQAAQMVTAFALALQGFERGEIAMGARKRRGFGACRVASWQVQRYDLREPAGLLAWLSDGRHGEPTAAGAGTAIAQLLGVDPGRTDQREYCTLTATFRLDSSLLIRAGGDEPNQPDMVHLTSKRSGQPVPIVSGTSMGGALRARALRIVNTIGSRRKAGEFVADLFGPKMEGANATPRASRVWVEECAIEAPPDPLIVQRVAIDRFTGGTLPGALFAQQPVFAGEDTRVKLAVTVQAAPADRPGAHSFKADLGLLLLVLKDLWTGDLPIGGEASVGRGRLVGETATLILHRAGADPGPTWMITQGAAGLAVQGDLDEMQACVDTLVKEVQA